MALRLPNPLPFHIELSRHPYQWPNQRATRPTWQHPKQLQVLLLAVLLDKKKKRMKVIHPCDTKIQLQQRQQQQ